jgi:hypothetical protein
MIRKCNVAYLTSKQARELEDILADLPAEKVQTLMDFAYYLHQRYASHPRRGSAEAILEVLERVGPLQIEEGELDALLQDIKVMRKLDMLKDD